MKILNRKKDKNEQEKEMEEYQQDIYKALKFYGGYRKLRISELNRDSPNWVRRKVPEDIEKLLYERRLISDKEKECFDPLYMITLKGHDCFIGLDEIYRKDWSLRGTIIAIISALISVYVLGKTLNWW